MYAEHWVTSLRLADSTIKGYRKIIRNHISPDLGRIRIDKLTATRIGSHYLELEKSGRKDEYGKGKPCRPTASTRCMSCSARSSTPRSTMG